MSRSATLLSTQDPDLHADIWKVKPINYKHLIKHGFSFAHEGRTFDEGVFKNLLGAYSVLGLRAKDLLKQINKVFVLDPRLPREVKALL